MKKLLTILFLFTAFLSKAQQITYTPMAQAGYGFKYQKSDSGNAMPFRNLSLGRGTDRPGPVIVNIADSGYYYYNGIEFIRLDGKVDSVTSSGNNVCQWKAGVPKCYLLNTGGNTFFGIDSLTYVGNSICWWKTGVPTCYSLIPGVDSVVVTGNQLCEWKQGVPTCYTINGNVLGTGIDSVTVIGTQLCQWTGGVSTCYTINSTSTGIDSLTFQDSILCSWTQGVSTCFNLSHRDTIKVTGNLLTVTYDSTGHQVLGTNHLDGLVSGGTVTLDSCLTIDVTAATFYKNFKLVLTAQILGLAITTPDGTNPRIDFVVADTLGNVSVIAGTPSPTPTGPAFNSGSQIVLASIYVPAAASCLSIMQEIIFDGITDNPSQYNIDTLGVTADFINMDKVFHLNQDLFISKYIDGGTITFTKPADYDTVKAGEIIKTPLFINGAFGNQIYMEFLKDGVPMTSPLLLNSYFSLLDSTEYQIPSVPLSSFTWTGENVFNGLRYTFHGYDTTGAKGLYLDWSQLQIGFSPQIKQYVDSIKVIDNFVYYYINGIAYLGGPVGGGGGSETMQQTFDNSVTAGDNPIISLGSNVLNINDDLSTLILADPNNHLTWINNYNGRGSNAQIFVETDTTDFVGFGIAASDSVHNPISIYGNAQESYIEQTADENRFTGTMIFNTVTSGSSTDSIATIDPDTHELHWRDAASLGGSGSLQDGFLVSVGRGDDPDIDGGGIHDFKLGSIHDVDIQAGGAGGSGSINLETTGPSNAHSDLVVDNSGAVTMYGENTLTGHSSYFSVAHDSIQITPYNGIIRWDSIAAASGLTNKFVVVWDDVSKRLEQVPTSSIGGSIPPNIGSGFRVYAPQTPGFKTLFCVGCTLDSATNTNALTITIPSTQLTRQIITSGSSGTVTGGNYIVTIDPASTLAAYTLTMPASPTDLQIVEVDFGGTLTSGVIVTALIVSANSGQTILDNTPPISATADNTLFYRYRTANTTWYRFKP